MLKVAIDIEAIHEEDAQLVLEHIAEQIGRGYGAGEGWAVTGESEDSDKEENEEE